MAKCGLCDVSTKAHGRKARRRQLPHKPLKPRAALSKKREQRERQED